jgi:hypothetical protein
LPCRRKLAVVGEFGNIHQIRGVKDSVLQHIFSPGSTDMLDPTGEHAYTEPKKIKMPW